MNEIWTSIVGNVATQPKTALTANGHAVTSFRVASTIRRYDKGARDWVDGDTSFVSVVCWRRLAENVSSSVAKGDPVVVHGRLKVKEWERDGRSGTMVEIEASSVGHDLSLGTSMWARNPKRAPAEVPAHDNVADELAQSAWLEPIDDLVESPAEEIVAA